MLNLKCTWEQRKFSDLVIIERGGSPRPIEDYITDSADGLNWVKIGDAPEQGNYITKTAEKIRPEGLSKTREVHPGDLILSNSMSFGKPYIMGIDGCIHDGWLAIREVQRNFDLKFLCVLLGTNQMLEQYRSFAAGSTVNNLNKELVGNTTVSYPNKDEQKQIGEYFEQLDHLITLHQRKYDKLQKIKKSMLQKMFPQNGSLFPEIRFEGFTDTWEQRKLGEQMYIKARIGWQALTKSEYLESGDYYLITGTDIDESSHTVDLKRCFYVSKERYEMDEKIQVQEGDIIVTKDGTIGKVAMVTGLDRPATLNSHLFVLRDLSGKVDNYFLLTVLNSHLFDSFVESTKTGSTLTGMPQKTFVEFTFLLPNIEEQKRIASYFRNLDHLITLHQRKLDKLKNIKKSMLEKMFV